MLVRGARGACCGCVVVRCVCVAVCMVCRCKGGRRGAAAVALAPPAHAPPTPTTLPSYEVNRVVNRLLPPSALTDYRAAALLPAPPPPAESSGDEQALPPLRAAAA